MSKSQKQEQRVEQSFQDWLKEETKRLEQKKAQVYKEKGYLPWLKTNIGNNIITLLPEKARESTNPDQAIFTVLDEDGQRCNWSVFYNTKMYSDIINGYMPTTPCRINLVKVMVRIQDRRTGQMREVPRYNILPVSD